MAKFSYTTTYFSLAYLQKGNALSGTRLTPNIDGFFENKQYQSHLHAMGEAGWELVSTESVMQPAYEAAGLFGKEQGFPITDGFFLFWKRIKEE